MSYSREPQRTIPVYPEPLPIDYGPLLAHDSPPSHVMPPYPGPPLVDYGTLPHAQGFYGAQPPHGPISPYPGPLPGYGPPRDDPPLPYRGPPPPYVPEGHALNYYYNGPGDGPYPPHHSYRGEENNYSEEDDDDDDSDSDDDESVIQNDLEDALMDVSVQLPRLAVTVPPSVLPPKGEGLCGLPNLGNTCYLNAVLQCLYYTPQLPARLAQACQGLKEGYDVKKNVAQALSTLMRRMDDVGRLKKGILAYFKGVCCLRNEQFAGEGQQEAHDLVAGLLLWLHQDLASQVDVDCACTKSLLKKTLATTTTNNKKDYHALLQDSARHHLTEHPKPQLRKGYKFHPPTDPEYPHSYEIFTGSTYDYTSYQPKIQYDSNHEREETQKKIKPLSPSVGGQEGEVCIKCGVTFQRRSFISDLFEGILQREIICPKAGVILITTWERFTSLTLPIRDVPEITLEEALEGYFRVSTFVWDCEHCGSTHACHQQSRILSAPPILIIHLSRYTDRLGSEKQNVIYPIDRLKIQQHMKSSKERTQPYSLFGVCSHHGSKEAGHYTAFCWVKRNRDKLGSWYNFDDEEVRQVSRFRHSREAHILFYSADGFDTVQP